VSVSPVYCKKNSTRFKQNWRRRYILKSAPIAITQVWTRYPHPMLCARRKHRSMPIAQQMTPFAAGKVWHWHTAKRYVQKLDIGRVHNFGMERIQKFGIWARLKLRVGHDVRRAFQTGGIRIWGRNPAVKTNRLVCLSLHHFVCHSGDLSQNS